MTFEERSKLGLEQLSKQKPVTLEDARNQVKKLKSFLSFDQFMTESINVKLSVKDIENLDNQEMLDKIYPYRNDELEILPEIIAKLSPDYDTPSSWFTIVEPPTFMRYFQRSLTVKKRNEIALTISDFSFPCECVVESVGDLSNTSSIIRLKKPSSDVRECLNKLGVKNVSTLSFVNCKLLLSCYHRIHSPVKGVVKSVKFIAKEDDLFGDNTLTLIEIQTPRRGTVYLMAVGELKIQDFEMDVKVKDQIEVFQEIGKFNWGSQCVILYDSTEWITSVVPGKKYFVGDPISMTFEEERSKVVIDQLEKPVPLEDALAQVKTLKDLSSFSQFMAESVNNGVVTCDNCGWEWDLSAGGVDPYTCHKCKENTSSTPAEIYTAKEIVDYVTQISDTPETDVPDYYFELILKDGSKFVKRTLKIVDLLKKDKSLEEYVKSGEDRYEDSDYAPSHKELENPVVIYKGEVIDGYNRISTKYRNGEKEVEAYVSL